MHAKVTKVCFRHDSCLTWIVVPIVVEGKAGDRHNLTTDTGATDNEPNKVFVENDNALMGNTTMSAVQGRAGDIHDLAMGSKDLYNCLS